LFVDGEEQALTLHQPEYLDTMYKRLPNVPGFGIEHTADKIGMTLAAVATAAFTVHGALNALSKD